MPFKIVDMRYKRVNKPLKMLHVDYRPLGVV